MKENESFDNALFMKLTCVLTAIALVCVVVFVIIGAVGGGESADHDTTGEYESFTFAPSSSSAPETTAPVEETTASETTAAPGDTTAAPDVTTIAPVETTAPETTAASNLTALPESPAILAESADMGQEYIDSIIFLGDSTTYGMGPYAVLKDGRNTKQVWTPVNGTLTLDQAVKKKIKYPETGEEITPAEAAAQKLPAYMVITLGVNGVSFMNEEQFITEYKKLVESIKQASPETKIILQSIFPVGTNWEKQESINNQKITLANTWVLKVAEACGVKYLDTASVLHGDDGWLIASYQNGDGMHFNEVGYRAVLNYIRTHGYAE